MELDVAKDKSILVAALEASITMEHACGGQAQCSTCVIEVVSSGENLTPVSKQEKNFLMNSDERLACRRKFWVMFLFESRNFAARMREGQQAKLRTKDSSTIVWAEEALEIDERK